MVDARTSRIASKRTLRRHRSICCIAKQVVLVIPGTLIVPE